MSIENQILLIINNTQKNIISFMYLIQIILAIILLKC